MNPAMKQRLVGTLVLGSLALILIPLLLDGEGVERPPLSATIPAAPVFDTTPLPEPERPVILADTLADTAADTTADITTDTATDTTTAEPADASLTTDPPVEDTTAAPADTNPEAVPPAEVTTTEPVPTPAATPVQSISEPALDPAGLPESWTVRLGSFGNRGNADALVARLILAGHKAYIRPVMSGDVALSGVFVGPVLTRNEAVALSNELKSAFQISDAIVQRFDIAQ